MPDRTHQTEQASPGRASPCRKSCTFSCRHSPGFPNGPPTIETGAHRTVNEGDIVTLSGTATDPDGYALTCLWEEIGHRDGRVGLADPSSIPTTFMAPEVDGAVTFTLRLTVSDGTATASVIVNVTVMDAG